MGTHHSHCSQKPSGTHVRYQYTCTCAHITHHYCTIYTHRCIWQRNDKSPFIWNRTKNAYKIVNFQIRIRENFSRSWKLCMSFCEANSSEPRVPFDGKMQSCWYIFTLTIFVGCWLAIYFFFVYSSWCHTLFANVHYSCEHIKSHRFATTPENTESFRQLFQFVVVALAAVTFFSLSLPTYLCMCWF